MALSLENETLENGLVASNVYLRVWCFAPERQPDPDDENAWEERTRIFWKKYVWDGENAPAKNAKPYTDGVSTVDKILQGNANSPDNAFQLAYEALKDEVEEFSEAEDV